MSAAIVGALTPFPVASPAICVFHASKPAAVLPHCAATASLVNPMTVTMIATVPVVSWLRFVMPNSFRTGFPFHELSHHSQFGAFFEGSADRPDCNFEVFVDDAVW